MTSSLASASMMVAALLFSFGAGAESRNGSGEYSAGQQAAGESIKTAIDSQGAIHLLWRRGGAEAEACLRALLVEGFIEGERDSSRTLGFEWVGGGPEGTELSEGGRGGARLPSAEADDDGDGLIDEDVFDGRDNDGDGLEDEDFAAIGEKMRVARALDGEGKARVLHNTYTWSYEHARDFAGFTTRVESEDGEGVVKGWEDGARIDFEVGRRPAEGREETKILLPADSKNDSLPGERDTLSLEYFKSGQGLAALVIFNADSCIERDGRSFSVPLGKREEGAGGLKIEWAIVFAESLEELKENASVAVKTFEGHSAGEDTGGNWVVPARKTAVLDLESDLATVWMGSSRRRALVIKMPSDMAGAPIKWVRINGETTEDYTRTGLDMLLPLTLAEDGGKDSLLVEGQLEDGVIFRAGASPEEMTGASRNSSENGDRLPESFMSLHPNPFAENVTIALDISRVDESGTALSGGKVFTGGSSVRIYDVKGLLIRVVMEREFMPPGKYTAAWDGTDERGNRMPPGVYYCSLRIGQRSITKRVILLR